MRRYIFYIIMILILAAVIIYALPKKEYSSDNVTLAEGKRLFSKNCMSCHSLTDDGFGPPLGGITNLLSKKALVDFIRDPSKVIAAGDERAVAQQAKYKRVMPSFESIAEQEIVSILAYIHDETQLHHIEPVLVNAKSKPGGLTGRMVAPIKKSGLKIELEDVVQLPQLNTTTDLGVATLRAGPSGDGTLFASDQNGIIYRIKDGKASIFLDMKSEVKDFQNGPGIATGIASFDFHPDFLHNGLLFIAYAESFKGQKADYVVSLADTLRSVVQWVVSEWKMDDVKSGIFKGTHRELLRLHAPNFAHGFQDMSFIPGLKKNDPEYGLLYFGYGDGGSNNLHHPELGHHLRSFLGTIMRIDPAGTNSTNGKYGIPASNPFVQEKDPLIVKEIYAYGFRNPHRMTWDKLNGNRMMATDIGESYIEELNIVEKGGDYGWPRREGNYGINTVTDLKTVFKVQQTDDDLYKYKRPFAQYDHEEGNAISGGFVYEGGLKPLQHKYVFGDIVTGKLFYLKTDPLLSDSTVYEIDVVRNGVVTNLKEMDQSKRLHLRIGYDPYKKNLYVISKVDGMIRRVAKAY
ncbi:MAG: PQQ-dependent sugar dehydrogenase [Chitinophagaceae bacterium]